MKNKSLSANLIVLFIAIILGGCGNNAVKNDETPTHGNIKIAADESFKLLVDSQNYTFHALYKYAIINPVYKAESDVISDFMKDSVRTIIVSRKLTDNEEKSLISQRFIPRTTKIAYDGVAFILNKANLDSNLRYDQIQGIFQGRITKWNQIDPKSTLGDIIVVFDQNGSGNFRYVKEKFIQSSPVSKNCFAVKSNPEVLEYVKDKKNAIGVIGVNWISDKDDPVSNKFLQGITVAGIGIKGDTEGSNEFRKPYQGYIADGSYPLTREVFVISRESFKGLGSGFASFMAGDVGQRMILKSGLVPATMPVRLVQVKKSF